MDPRRARDGVFFVFFFFLREDSVFRALEPFEASLFPLERCLGFGASGT